MVLSHSAGLGQNLKGETEEIGKIPDFSRYTRGFPGIPQNTQVFCRALADFGRAQAHLLLISMGVSSGN